MRRFFRYYHIRFKRLQGQPKIIARGIAIGLFIGVTPTIPLHTILLISICFPLRASKLAAFLASCLISNPITLFLQYYLCWRIGSIFFPGLLSWEKMQNVLNILANGHGYHGFKESLIALGALGFDAALVMLCGGVILAIPITIAGYYYSLKFFIKLREKRDKKKS